MVDRPRPSGGLVERGGSGYPSGHAAHSIFYAWLALTVRSALRPGWAGGTALIVAGLLLTAPSGSAASTSASTTSAT